MIETRTSYFGRKPTLRDNIFNLLLKSKYPLTVREIALALRKDVTTPFRALQDLKRHKLLNTIDTDSGTAYFVNLNEYNKRLKWQENNNEQ